MRCVSFVLSSFSLPSCLVARTSLRGILLALIQANRQLCHCSVPRRSIFFRVIALPLQPRCISSGIRRCLPSACSVPRPRRQMPRRRDCWIAWPRISASSATRSNARCAPSYAGTSHAPTMAYQCDQSNPFLPIRNQRKILLEDFINIFSSVSMRKIRLVLLPDCRLVCTPAAAQAARIEAGGAQAYLDEMRSAATTKTAAAAASSERSST